MLSYSVIEDDYFLAKNDVEWDFQELLNTPSTISKDFLQVPRTAALSEYKNISLPF